MVNVDDVAWREVGPLVVQVSYGVWADNCGVIGVEGCIIDD